MANNKNKVLCKCCGKLRTSTDFFVSLNSNHDKYLPYCRSCISTQLRKYIELTGSDKIALWCVCAELGYPILRDYFEVTFKYAKEQNLGSNVRDSNLFIIYQNVLRESGIVLKGLWQSDLSITEITNSFHQEQSTLSAKEVLLLKQENYKNWGKFSDDEYKVLNDFYELYTASELNLDVAKELRYRDLCKAELRKRKADESGDRAEIKDAEASIKNMMNMLKLDSFENNKKTEIDRHIERMAWEVENTKPCECADLEKYKDFSNFGIKWEEIMRCVKNLVSGSREYPDLPKDI